MSIWFAIPTARPLDEANQCFAAWGARGYRTAAFINPGAPRPAADRIIEDGYSGYPKTVNRLCRLIVTLDPGCIGVITGGDDVYPDPIHTIEALSEEFTCHFNGALGVMQPTGDGHGAKEKCVSPLLGRDYILRGYEGRGPLCELYWHFYVDEELHQVARRLGLLWNRADMLHRHEHWTRLGGKPPRHLKAARNRIGEDRAIYRRRLSAGFPGSGLAA